MENSKTVLRVKNASKKYKTTLAVDNISLAVKKGEILGMLGPNGAGKTSLIRMIMDIIAPDSGSIDFSLDDSIGSDSWQEKVGYLPEERGLYQQAKVKDIFSFLGGLKGMNKTEAQSAGKKWLQKFELESHFADKIEELSKGMAQKVQFIASIIHDPELLILDEPFSGLEPVSQDVMIEEIDSLARQGMAIMLSSHRMNLVEELCHNIFFIDHGQEVISGRLENIKENYGSYRVKLRTDEATKMTEFVKNSAIITNHSREEGRWQLLLEDEAGPEDFMQLISDQNIPVKEISISRISLHDIFVRVARGGFLHEKIS